MKIKTIFVNILVFLGIMILFMIFLFPLVFAYASINLPERVNNDNPGKHGVKYEIVTVKTEDNITLRGWYMPAKENKGTILVCHGVGANKSHILPVALMFQSGGYNVYQFDFRNHGDSDKTPISYGYKERKDIKAIIKFIKSRGVNKLGLYGLSMGGAIVLLSTPENSEVQAVIADSAYASVERVLKYRVHFIYPEPLVNFETNLIEFYVKLLYNVPIQEIEPIKVVPVIKVPKLFILGDKDKNITPDNGYDLYKNASQPKELLVIKGANHIQTIYSSGYKDKILEFMNKYLH